MALYCLFVLLFCFVWRTTDGLYVSEDEKLVRRIRSTDYDQLYNEHLASLKPGQIMPYRCAYTKHGCCKDGKTRAMGPRGGSCDMILCTDKYVQFCYDKKEANKLKCNTLRDRKNCPYSCGKCRPRAAPLTKCLRKKTIHGCCWNGRPSLKADQSDCPLCINSYPKTCQTFSILAGGCISGSYGVRSFMTRFCPLTCGFCQKSP